MSLVSALIIRGYCKGSDNELYVGVKSQLSQNSHFPSHNYSCDDVNMNSLTFW